MTAPTPDRATALLICDLPQLALLSITGADAQQFLQNQLSCDVSAVTLTGSTYGAYCTPKGRMLASFLLWRSEQGYFMQLPQALREPIQKRLSTYVLRSKVGIADASADWVAIGVAGRDAAGRVRSAAGAAPQAPHEVAHRPDAMTLRLPPDRFEIVAARGTAPAMMEALMPGAKLADPEYWDWLDIRAGVPVVTAATQDQFVPQMANLDLIGGVSYTKGCYPGQEIVARMHYLGKLKQRMYLAHVASQERPQPGEKLYSPEFGEQPSGTIVNAARSPDGGYEVLAVMQVESAERGDVHWKSPEGPPLRLLPLPYEIVAN